MDLTALVDNLAPAIQVCFVRGVLDCFPFCESEIGASGLVVCQYASPGASRSPFAGFVFTVTTS